MLDQGERSSRAMKEVAIRWCATSSKEGEGAVLYREKESCGNTWKDRVIYCYGRLLSVVCVWVSRRVSGADAPLRPDSFFSLAVTLEPRTWNFGI